MDIRKKQKAVVTALEDVKARDITAFNVEHLTALFDRVIIATGESARQVKSLARNVHNVMSEIGERPLSIEGEQEGEWVLVDLGDIIVHVMHPAVRQYYNLEELWGQAKPRKAGAPREPRTREPRTSESRSSESRASEPRKPGAKRAPRAGTATREPRRASPTRSASPSRSASPTRSASPARGASPTRSAASPSRGPAKSSAPRARKKAATKSS